MTVVRDLLADALTEIGVIDPGAPMDADTSAFALRTLNRMLSAWANDDLMTYTVNRVTFPLVANTQNYTIGTTGTWVTASPVRPGQIDMASVLVNGTEIPLKIYNDEQWRDTPVKSTAGTFPTAVWQTGDYPLNILTFWPVPTAVNTVVLYIWGQINAFPDVNATVTLPQGYEDAIVYNLAVRLAASFGKEPNPSTASLANAAKARVKNMNYEATYRSVDETLNGNGGANSVWLRSRGYVLG